MGSLCHAANSHLLSVLHMVIYMFLCNSLKSSHLLPLPLCPKFSSMSLKKDIIRLVLAPLGLSLVLVSRGYSLLQGAGFSLRWLLSLQSAGSRARGLQHSWRSGLVVLWHVQSSLIRDQTLAPCISRWILAHWTAREVLQYILAVSNVWDLACFQTCSSGSDT